MRTTIAVIFFIFLILSFSSCNLDDYLDQVPEAGLSEEQVFSNYQNFNMYFQGIYDGEYYYYSRPNLDPQNWGRYSLMTSYPVFYAIGNQRKTWDSMTELIDDSRIEPTHTLKQGNFMQYSWLYTNYANYVPLVKGMFMVIRRCNMVLEKIHMLQNVSEQVKDDFKGQAYFARAWAHFALFRTWGRMPYITHVIGPDDEWDLERLSSYETCMHIAADLDTAVMYFQKADVMRRDNPVPGSAGHLDHPDLFRPNGCAAKAIKARVLLYAASPLYNDKGQVAWENAAKANWEAIVTALQYGYDLLPANQRKLNFVGARYTNEQIWTWHSGVYAWNNAALAYTTNGLFVSSATSKACNPTQNAVDKYETRWGDPLNTEADKLAAISAGQYNPQDPYKDRDPRFYEDIIFNTTPIPGYGTAQIFYEIRSGVPVYSNLLNRDFRHSHTGYYIRKVWNGQSTLNRINTILSDPLMRLAELYLNYAEAANEAYGPNTPAPGASMTALQAVNLIRERVNMVPVQTRFTQSIEVFRERVKNERIVEFYFEGHHYFHDSRRWKDAPAGMSGTIKGMDIEKLPAGYDVNEYPTGYRYKEVPLTPDRQATWKDAMYYFCFEIEDMQKMKKFEPNEVW